jgi:uncharacterized repeat protein (TIGR03803 family)
LSDGLVQSIQINYEALLTPVASFPGSEGANPFSPLLQAGDGNFYGTTANGGNYGDGTVFRITPGGVSATLYSFTGAADGSGSVAGLIQADDGWLYGTTEYGGAYGYGTVFQISTSGSLTTLYSFTGAEDGGNPTASLIQGRDGGLYGTAAGGDFYGTVFRITPGGQFTLLYSFTGVDDGAFPEAALVQARDGGLYGTANQGGINGVGTVFRVGTNGGFDTLFSFNRTDGASPSSALIQGADGYLYGTASLGGEDRTGSGFGTVFRLSTNGAYNPLHLFTGGNDGGSPVAGVIQARDGYLYGTASSGGSNGYGAVFRVSTNGGFTPLYSFTDGADGASPDASLIQAADGSFYGTASSGGNYNYGTVFKITTNGVFSLLHTFLFSAASQTGASGALVVSGGNLYGTTQYGGAYSEGAIFQLTTNGTLSILYSFDYWTGHVPLNGIIQANNGCLYGTTEYGGAGSYGTVFQVSTNGVYTLLHSFDYWDGANPQAALVQAGNGCLYGTTSRGGTNGGGTVFQISTNGAFAILHTFDYSDGNYPMASLIQASDGCLYGTTTQGGIHGAGTVFQISTNGSFALLYSFADWDGGYPVAALLQAGNGCLYGTTSGGGYYGSGTIFRITTNGAFTSLYSFTNGIDGANPAASLVQAPDGNLYGTTSSGGVSGYGAVFQITPGGAFTPLYSFSGGSDGGDPGGGLVVFGGYLCGVTQSGGANGQGDVFALLIPQSTGLPPLTVAFTATPTNGVAPLAVTFTAADVDSGGHAITNWNWSFGDGATSTVQNPSHTYTTAGSFSPVLMATNNFGGGVAGSGPASITVTGAPARPGIAGVGISGASLVLNGSNGLSGGTYYVLTSTNIAMPLNQWTPIATNVLGAGGDFTITAPNTVSPDVPQRYYILQTQ